MSSHVKAMVDYFEEKSTGETLISSSEEEKKLSTKNRKRGTGTAAGDDDDELLSYDSENDIDPIDGQSSSDKNTVGTNAQVSQYQEIAPPTPIVIPPTACTTFDDDDDDQNLVYSSDDDSTLPQISPLVALTPHNESNSSALTEFKWPPAAEPNENNSIHEGAAQNSSKIDIVNSKGQSPLSIASKQCQLEVMEMLIFQGCNIDLADLNGLTPLHHVCSNTSSKDNLLCMRLLLQNGASTNHQDNQGSAPLHKVKSYECAECLISFGACPKLQDNFGNTPLHDAIRTADVKLIKLLAEAKDCSESCICASLVYREQDFVEEYEQQNEVQVQVEDPFDALDSEEIPNSRSMEIWQKFFENAAKSNKDEPLSQIQEDNMTLKTESYPLHDAIRERDVNFLKGLLQIGHDVNSVERDTGNTPLHLAAFLGDLSIIVCLVDYGADINCTNKADETPLSLCVSKGHTKCADFLFCYGRENYSLLQYMNISVVFWTVYEFVALVLHFVMRLPTRTGDNKDGGDKNPPTKQQDFSASSYEYVDASYPLVAVPIPTPVPEDVVAALESTYPDLPREIEPPEDYKNAIREAGLVLKSKS